jgi:cytochrome P450
MPPLAWMARSTQRALKAFNKTKADMEGEIFSDLLKNHLQELCRYVEQKLQLQKFLQSAEANLQKATTSLGMDLITPDKLLPSVVASLLAIIFIGLIVRKMRNQNRHRQLYGENGFPPFAPSGVMGTFSALAETEQPWLFKKCAKHVGPVFRLKLPFSPFRKLPMLVAVGDLDAAKEILLDPKTIKPEELYSSIASIAGGPNIVTSEGHHWRISRKGVAPAFVKTHLDRMHKICKDKTEEWIKKKLEPSIESDESFDVSQEFLHLTLTIICMAAFEYRVKEKEAETVLEDFAIAMREFAFDQVHSPLRASFGILLPSVRRARSARVRVQGFAEKILETYRKKPRHLRSQEDTIISCIDKNNKYENDDQRIADIVMFIFAGHDTTAFTLAWILLELARNPSELKQLRDALTGNDDFVAQEMLKDILREGMRLRPVVSGVGVRTVGRDFYMKDKAIVIPKGSQVLFPSLLLTRHGVEDPEEFRPSRWREHPEKSFLPFSTGRRNCVGQSLALAEITWVLSRLCAKYDFTVVDEGRPEYCETLKCAGARLKARQVHGQGGIDTAET